MNELKFDEDVVFEKSQVAEVIERICVQRAKHLDDAIFGEIKEIIKEHEHLTVVNLNEKAIVDALEKQISKKPTPHIVGDEKIKIGNGTWCKGTTVYRCPKCNDFVSRVYKHCPDCGQALDWSDTDG